MRADVNAEPFPILFILFILSRCCCWFSSCTASGFAGCTPVIFAFRYTSLALRCKYSRAPPNLYFNG